MAETLPTLPSIAEIVASMPDENRALKAAQVAALAHISESSVVNKRGRGISDRQIVREGLARWRARAAQYGADPNSTIQVFAPTPPGRRGIGRPRKNPIDAAAPSPGAPPAAPASASAAPDGVDVGAALRGDENVTLFEAQRLKEIEQFRKLRLANDEKEARLVEADVVARVWANMATLLRNKLLAIPNTLAQRCAFETDPFEIRNMIDAEIKHALESFPTVVGGYETA
jgi:hypothetical protein